MQIINNKINILLLSDKRRHGVHTIWTRENHNILYMVYRPHVWTPFYLVFKVDNKILIAYQQDGRGRLQRIGRRVLLIFYYVL